MTKIPVDSELTGAGEYTVYGEYSVLLNQTNIDGDSNNNKFYVIQLLKETSKDSYSTWNRWGRVGEPGKSNLSSFGSDLNKAKNDFAKKFRDKTGSFFPDHDAEDASGILKSLAASFQKKTGKYMLVDVEHDADEAGTGSGAAASQNNAGTAGAQAFGKLTEAQIHKGQEVLAELRKCLQGEKKNKNKDSTKIAELSSQFYTLIPTNSGRKKPPPIDTEDLIMEKEASLEFMLRMGFDDMSVQLKKVSPLAGVMSLPLCPTLQAAAGSVSNKGAITQSDNAGKTLAQKQAGKPTSAMDASLYASICLYTGNSVYRQLNEALRAESIVKIQKYRPYLRQLLESFSYFKPQANKTVWRGVSVDLSKTYKLGSEITWWSVSSTTVDKNVAYNFAAGCGANSTLLEIKSQNALDVSALSLYSSEKECILVPGTKLKVTKVEKKPGQLGKIWLEELKGGGLEGLKNEDNKSDDQSLSSGASASTADASPITGSACHSEGSASPTSSAKGSGSQQLFKSAATKIKKAVQKAADTIKATMKSTTKSKAALKDSSTTSFGGAGGGSSTSSIKSSDTVAQSNNVVDHTNLQLRRTGSTSIHENARDFLDEKGVLSAAAFESASLLEQVQCLAYSWGTSCSNIPSVASSAMKKKKGAAAMKKATTGTAGKTKKFSKSKFESTYNSVKTQFVKKVKSASNNDERKLMGCYNDAAREVMVQHLHPLLTNKLDDDEKEEKDANLGDKERGVVEKYGNLQEKYYNLFYHLGLDNVLTDKQFTKAKTNMQYLLQNGDMSKEMQKEMQNANHNSYYTAALNNNGSDPSSTASTAATAGGATEDKLDIVRVKKVKGKRENVPVDSENKERSDFTVVLDKGEDAVYDVLLNLADIGGNNNKFYVLQLLEKTEAEKGDKDRYMVWTRWGRVGVSGQTQTKKFADINMAKLYFAVKFQDKTGNKWDDCVATPKSFQTKKGKYSLIEVEYDTDLADANAANDGTSKSKNGAGASGAGGLDPSVRSLLSLISNKKMMEEELSSCGFDPKKMPLGKISTSMVQKGYKLLQQINALLEAEGDNAVDGEDDAAAPPMKKAKTTTMKKDTSNTSSSASNKLEQLNSEFFTVIPHNFGFKKLKDCMIKTTAEVREKLELIDTLQQVAEAMRLLNSKPTTAMKTAAMKKATTSSSDALSNLYDQLDVDLTPVSKNSSTFQLVKRMLSETHNKEDHSGVAGRLKLESCFFVTKEKRDEDFEKLKKSLGTKTPPISMLLWHGSRLSNWMGILSKGLQIAPPEAPSTGYMFGKGIYFADVVSKSAQYCHAYSTSSQNRAILVLEEVAVGETLDCTSADFQAASKVSKHKSAITCKGVGQKGPLSWEEVKMDDEDAGKVTTVKKFSNVTSKDLKSTTSSSSCYVPTGNVKKQNKSSSGYLLHNEYVVYDTKQTRPRLLCVVDFRNDEESESEEEGEEQEDQPPPMKKQKTSATSSSAASSKTSSGSSAPKSASLSLASAAMSSFASISSVPSSSGGATTSSDLVPASARDDLLKASDHGQWRSVDNSQLLCFNVGHVMRHLKNVNKTSSVRVASFDMDWTLINTKSGSQHPKDANDWKWAPTPAHMPEVPQRLAELITGNNYDCIVVFSMQGGIEKGKTKETDIKAKIASMWDSLCQTSPALKDTVCFCASPGESIYRKPCVGGWDLLFGNGSGIQHAVDGSFFVGDAAGRPKTKARAKDFSDTDFKFALNVGIKFKLPEWFFNLDKNAMDDVPSESTFSFRPSYHLANGAAQTGTSPLGMKLRNSLFDANLGKKEMIVFVGAPASGKSSLTAQMLEGNNVVDYVVINQDKLKTVPKCEAAAKEALKNGKSVIIDNQNKEKAKRKNWIALAKEMKCDRVRAVYFDVSKDFCFHMNHVRARLPGTDTHGLKRERVPSMVIHTFFKYAEKPQTAEGFSEVLTFSQSDFRLGPDAKANRMALMYQD
ncbi:unnamed protein product [Amoebophrya sp. A25]|nr:unnamed protein product [Amoebophrya sp. A25]|eukprot:GSA25T00025132001.1